jgi:thiamine biosynthesis protein ThiI
VSPPYTSDRAQLKVEQLCQKLTDWCGGIAFYCVPFTELQEAIKDHCPEEFFTIIMRRLMREIAQRIAAKDNCLALITGESVGQVASQTAEALVVTDASVQMPVMRPLIGMDKVDIMDLAQEIGTYEKSIEPYEDCCTVFLPKHPSTKPKLEKILESEAKLDCEQLIKDAIASEEIVTILPHRD